MIENRAAHHAAARPCAAPGFIACWLCASRADVRRHSSLPREHRSWRRRFCSSAACCSISLLIAAALIESLVRPAADALQRRVVPARRRLLLSRSRRRRPRCPWRTGRRGQCARRSAAEASACAPSKPPPCWRAFSKSCTRPCSPSIARMCCSSSTTPDPSCLGLPHARCFGRTAPRTWARRSARIARPEHPFLRLQNPLAGCCARPSFRQDGVPHTLLLLADVSLPLQEEEQAAWKRLIRVLGHELSNSLAPIKSIAGSLLARVDSHAWRRGHHARFPPRPRRGGEPRRFAAPFRAVVSPARPVAPAAAQAGSAARRCWSAWPCSSSVCPCSSIPGPRSRCTPIPISWSRCSSTCSPTPSTPRWPMARSPSA